LLFLDDRLHDIAHIHSPPEQGIAIGGHAYDQSGDCENSGKEGAE
jgi:hypothetical protein